MGSVELLKNARVFESIEAAVADAHLIFATSARSRGMNQSTLSPQQAALEMISSEDGADQATRMAIVFGPETNGLLSNEVAVAHHRIEIPCFEHYGVLNLSHAVSAIAYEYFASRQRHHHVFPRSTTEMSAEQTALHPSRRYSEAPASRAEVFSFISKLEEILGVGRDYNHEDFPKRRKFSAKNINQLRLIFQRVSNCWYSRHQIPMSFCFLCPQ